MGVILITETSTGSPSSEWCATREAILKVQVGQDRSWRARVIFPNPRGELIFADKNMKPCVYLDVLLEVRING